eukprot:1603159-Pleurochrysis_carterae.AAC.1
MPASRMSVPVIITHITSPAILDMAPRIASVQNCSPALSCAILEENTSLLVRTVHSAQTRRNKKGAVGAANNTEGESSRNVGNSAARNEERVAEGSRLRK